MIDRILLQVAVGPGHQVVPVLLGLEGVTGGAVPRCYNRMCLIVNVFKGILVRSGIHGVTFGATDHNPGKGFGNLVRRDESV